LREQEIADAVLGHHPRGLLGDGAAQIFRARRQLLVRHG
jgi:hypothetical protein